MSTSESSKRVPRLRLRWGETESDIIDLGWSPRPEEEDDDPWSIAFLVDAPHPAARQTWDVEDPTDPDNDTYPPREASALNAFDFIRCAASHWQRVHPNMRRFTQEELENAGTLAALGAVRPALDLLVEARSHECGFKFEQRPSYR